MREIATKLLEEAGVNKLPSLPHILIKLLSACRDDNVSFDKVTEIISKDAALSAKVISVANSPVYCHTRNLTSFKHTLMYLGLDTIKSIAITASVQQFFSKYSTHKNTFLKDFWKHALSCAIIARSLAKLTSYKCAEEAYLAGLLHDIGKLVLENNANFDYNKIDHASHSTEELLAIEKQNFNISHDELGGRLLTKWDITESISDAARFHHADIEEIQEAHQLTKIINLANKLALNTSEQNNSSFEYAHRLFDLSESLINDMVISANEEVSKVAKSLNIDIGNDDTKQIELAQEVRDIAFSKGTHLPLEENESHSIFSSIQKCTMLLLGIRKSIIFTYNKDNNSVSAPETQALVENSFITDLKIPLNSNSLLTKSLDNNSIQDSFIHGATGKLAVVDQQLTGALKSEGILCIPVKQQDEPIAVIVCAVNHVKCSELNKNRNLLITYAGQIASSIDDSRKSSLATHQLLEDNQAIFKAKAREIIHETNNPLSVIRNYLQLLGKKLDTNKAAQDDINIIKEEIDRVGSIILRCAEDVDNKKQPGHKKLDINELITNLNNIFKSSLYSTHGIKSELDLDLTLQPIALDKNSAKQIITNLIKNAVEAIVDNGIINIATRKINVNGKTFIEMEIKDNGPGISETVLKDLYLPVNSTKGKTHSGLGLSIVKNLIDKMNGSITCRTGKTGTTFNILFPK
ncbi:MAG: HDOD domain-containing protein [Gammaproteobacteria bacterium]|nr:HDOD domain-containing protein [Gammaproteobacteria bacterium]